MGSQIERVFSEPKLALVCNSFSLLLRTVVSEKETLNKGGKRILSSTPPCT